MEKHHFAEPMFWIFCCCSEEHVLFLESITHHRHDKGLLCCGLIGAEFRMGHTLVCGRSGEEERAQRSHQWQTGATLLLLAFGSFFSGGCYCQYLSLLITKLLNLSSERQHSRLCVHCWGRSLMRHWLLPAPPWTWKPDLVLNLNHKLSDQFLDHSCDAPNRQSCIFSSPGRDTLSLLMLLNMDISI